MTHVKVKLTGNKRNQCPVCGALFTTDRVFDKHRVGSYAQNERRCLDAVGMTAKGMFLGDDGFWRGEKMPEGGFAKRNLG